jgi:hypothetical protein
VEAQEGLAVRGVDLAREIIDGESFGVDDVVGVGCFGRRAKEVDVYDENVVAFGCLNMAEGIQNIEFCIPMRSGWFTIFSALKAATPMGPPKSSAHRRKGFTRTV